MAVKFIKFQLQSYKIFELLQSIKCWYLLQANATTSKAILAYYQHTHLQVIFVMTLKLHNNVHC